MTTPTFPPRRIIRIKNRYHIFYESGKTAIPGPFDCRRKACIALFNFLEKNKGMFNSKARFENKALKKAVENNSAANNHYKSELSAMRAWRLVAAFVATTILSLLIYMCA